MFTFELSAGVIFGFGIFTGIVVSVIGLIVTAIIVDKKSQNK